MGMQGRGSQMEREGVCPHQSLCDLWNEHSNMRHHPTYVIPAKAGIQPP